MALSYLQTPAHHSTRRIRSQVAGIAGSTQLHPYFTGRLEREVIPREKVYNFSMASHQRPQTQSAPYITPEGYQGLQQELDGLWKRRATVTRALAAAAAEGDRSENAEYIYRKKELREIDRRIRYLQKRLPALTVVRDPPSDRERIYFGAWVSLEDKDGNLKNYRIVGPDEFDLKQGHISVDSPLARALLKKAADEEVTVQTPQGPAIYYVINIRYGGAD